MRLKDKVAIVTGAASGFGAEIARQYVAEGARVAIADINTAGARAVAGELGDNAPAELKSMLEGKVQAVKDAISSDDVDKINASVADLEGSLQALAEAAQGAAGAGQQPDVEPGADSDSESSEPKQAKGKVVDAEVVD